MHVHVSLSPPIHTPTHTHTHTHTHTYTHTHTHTHTHTQYLDLVQTLSDYSIIQFPHCACDARKAGHVMVTIGLDSLKLKACTKEG